MSRKRKQNSVRDAPRERSAVWLCGDGYDSLCVSGYTRLSDCPEVQMAVNYIADLVSSMTIHLMRNTEQGDVRVKNELSRKIDIDPYRTISRKNWLYYIVRNMILEGNQVVLPVTRNGYLEDLMPLPPGRTGFIPSGDSYTVRFGEKIFQPEDVLHFLINPDPDRIWYGTGYRVALRDITRNLKQAAATKNGFMSSKWKPSVIVKVDALTEEFASRAGRQKLLSDYLESSEAGEPWMIPAEQFDVQQVKPLSLNDLAINDAVTIDKRSVAAIIGVPPYAVGVGDFDKDAHRAFINTKLRPIAQIIEQELTGKLLYSPELYFRMNARAIYAYDLQELADVGQGLYVRGIVKGNEVRDWLSMPPLDGLDELVMLENYIPAGMIGEQKKLNPSGGETG